MKRRAQPPYHAAKPRQSGPSPLRPVADPAALVLNALLQQPDMVQNTVTTRLAAIRKAVMDNRRDINEECGYPETLSPEHYRTMYDRGIGRRVVNVYPEETWKMLPEIYEDADPDTMTPFEESLDAINREHNLMHYMQRVDEMSGVGRYGVLLIGLDDGLPLDEPAAGLDAKGKPAKARAGAKITYLRVLDESLVAISRYETDPANPRYGQPVEYQLTLEDPSLYSNSNAATMASHQTHTKVHWTRVVHVADNRTTSEVLGTPRQQAPWDRLYDLTKILGGSGEMFWRGGFPGLSLETNPGIENPEIDQEGTRQAIWDYMNGLQRYLALDGMTAKSLAPQIADPTSSFEVQVKAICIIIGVPYPVFVGALEGQLAGDQNTKAWDSRIRNRQHRYVTPMLINPVLQRLIDLGCLVPPAEPMGWEVVWPDAHEPSDSDQATVASMRTEAFAKYVGGGVDVLIPPFEFLTVICGLEEDVAAQIIESALEHIEAADDGDMVPGRNPKPEALVGVDGQLPGDADSGGVVPPPGPKPGGVPGDKTDKPTDDTGPPTANHDQGGKAAAKPKAAAKAKPKAKAKAKKKITIQQAAAKLAAKGVTFEQAGNKLVDGKFVTLYKVGGKTVTAAEVTALVQDM